MRTDAAMLAKIMPCNFGVKLVQCECIFALYQVELVIGELFVIICQKVLLLDVKSPFSRKSNSYTQQFQYHSSLLRTQSLLHHNGSCLYV
jgi:hypothetical protein